MHYKKLAFCTKDACDKLESLVLKGGQVCMIIVAVPAGLGCSPRPPPAFCI